MKKLLLLGFILAVIASCKNDELSDTECISKVLKTLGMVPYKGQDRGCNSYLIMHVYQGEQYFVFANDCTDTISDAVYHPFDCDGKKICEDVASAACTNFYLAPQVTIVGIDLP